MIPSTPRLTTSESYADFLARDAAHRAGFGKPALISACVITHTEERKIPRHVASFAYADGTVRLFEDGHWSTHKEANA